MGQTVMVIASLPDSLVQFRGHLLKTMRERGHRVVAVAAQTDPLAGLIADAPSEMARLGIEYAPVPMARASISPAQDLNTIRALTDLIRKVKPDVVLSYTVKPNIFGSWSARRCGVPRIASLITGVASGLRSEHERRSPRGRLMALLYRSALRHNTAVIFQNRDDLELFRGIGLVSARNRCEVVNGSGVDLQRFAPDAVSEGPPVFLMIARLLVEKGVREYAAACAQVAKRFPETTRLLVGPLEERSEISREEVHRWLREGALEYLGPTRDVRPVLQRCSVYVLPSYREGTPRTVLEALATGRAIITTDAPGCRETVSDNVNGLIVPIKDSARLAEAMERFCVSSELATKMGAASLELAKRFDVRTVTADLLRILDL